MAIRSARNRKPFAEISNETSNKKKSTKKNVSSAKGKVEHRKSRQIGDDVIYYVQERKCKSGNLHPATVDPKTGGITFVPKHRKTPIAYDSHRHTLIETSPDGDHLEVKLKHVVGNGNIDVNVNQAIVSRKGYNDRKEAQRKRSSRPSQGYAESTDSEVENSDSDFDDSSEANAFPEPRKYSREEHNNSKSKLSNSNATHELGSMVINSIGKPMVSMKKGLIDDVNGPKVDDHRESAKDNQRPSFNVQKLTKSQYPEKDPKHALIATDSSTKEKRCSSPLRSTQAPKNSHWEESSDWRCAFAMDY